MSVDLCAKVKVKKETMELELWDLSTQIVFTITAGQKYLKKKEARRALLAYCEYVRYSTNGAWDSHDKYEEAAQNVKEHLEYISSFINDKSLEVYVL